MTASEQFIEATLVARSQAGDDLAFARLVELHHGPLLYFVRRMIGSTGTTDAADVVQEVWFAVFRQLPKLGHVGAFRSWMYRIARNHAVDTIRKLRTIEPFTDENEPIIERVAEPEFSADDAAKIHVGLAALKLEHREVLMLRFLESMSYQEIAEVVGCDLGTIKSRVFYAKLALRREMEKLL